MYRVLDLVENGNKHTLAEIVAARFPQELGGRLPPKRRPWKSEDYRMSIFDGLLTPAPLKQSKNRIVSCPKGCGLRVAPWKDSMTESDREKSECQRAEEDIKTLTTLANKLTGNCQDAAKKLLAYKIQYRIDHNCDSFKKK